MMETTYFAYCTGGRHRAAYPWGTVEMTGEGQLLLNCSATAEPEWFTCCEATAIARRRAIGTDGAVPVEVLTSRRGRLLHRLDLWGHDKPRWVRRLTCGLWDWHLGVSFRESFRPTNPHEQGAK